MAPITNGNDAKAKLAAIQAKLAQARLNLDKFKMANEAPAEQAPAKPPQEQKQEAGQVEKTVKKSPPPLPEKAKGKTKAGQEPSADNAEGPAFAENVQQAQAPDTSSLFEIDSVQEGKEAEAKKTKDPSTAGEIDGSSLFNDDAQADDREVQDAQSAAVSAFAPRSEQNASTIRVDPLPRPKKTQGSLLDLENSLEKVAGFAGGAVLTSLAALMGAGAFALAPLAIGSAVSIYYIRKDQTKGETQ